MIREKNSTDLLYDSFGSAMFFNPLMPGGYKKSHTSLNKPAAESLAFSCRFVQVCVTFLLPPGIKGLNYPKIVQIYFVLIDLMSLR